MSLKQKATLYMFIIITTLLFSIAINFIIDVLNTPAFSYKKSKNLVDLRLDEYQNISNVVAKSTDVELLKTSAWIPDWDQQDGFNTLKFQSTNFEQISPVWFGVENNGSLDIQYGANGSEFIDFCKANNIELIPTISLFDADILHEILINPENTNRHISEIVSQVNTNKYDGIDLDYESTYIYDKPNFFKFLEDLKLKLSQTNKKLVFTVMPKWGDYVNYASLPQTRRVQDYTRIAEIVDEFRIMTYEFSGRNSKEVAPIAPIEWMEEVVKYAIYKGVPRDKILVGIHTYAYDYEDREMAVEIKNGLEFVVFETQAPSAVALFGTQVQKVKDNYAYTQKYNEVWEEMILYYTFENKKRIIIYPNQDSIDARVNLAAKYGLKGVVYWRVGDDDELKY